MTVTVPAKSRISLAAEYDGAGAMAKRYFFGPGVDEPLVEDDASFNCSATRFLHADSQGSIIARADCSGNIVNRNTYDEWGIPGSGNAGRFQYTGQMWMPEIGMYYYKARMYSPTLGRFMQTDPIGYADQVNLYAYVGNDPIDGTDPSGEAGQKAGCGSLTPRDSEACPPADEQSRTQKVISWVKQNPIKTVVAAGAVIGTVVCILVEPCGLGEAAAAGTAAGAESAEATGVVETTIHGAARIAGANATRGGVLSEAQIAATRSAGQLFTQSNGARAYVAETSAGRFNVVVQNQSGKLITSFENLSSKALQRLSNNYGWH